MNKSYRQGQILKLIRTRPIHTQDELASALKKEMGIHATQVTLSRDMRELGLVKTTEGYRQVAAPSGPDFSVIAAGFLFDVRMAQNLIVLKTSPGHANSIAVALDQEEWAEIVGTIAGDDTILIVTPDVAAANAVRERFMQYLRPL
jgi:transcriptional regulator of arginine metabolism